MEEMTLVKQMKEEHGGMVRHLILVIHAVWCGWSIVGITERGGDKGDHLVFQNGRMFLNYF